MEYERENACTPVVDEWKSVVSINVPTKILVDSRRLHEVVPAIPVSVFSRKISENRSYKKAWEPTPFETAYQQGRRKEVLYESLVEKKKKSYRPV